MSDWLSHQLLQEREMWEKDEAAQAEYASWLKTITDGWLNRYIDVAMLKKG